MELSNVIKIDQNQQQSADSGQLAVKCYLKWTPVENVRFYFGMQYMKNWTYIVGVKVAGIKVLVQPSTNRCFSEDDFEEAGAVFSEDVSAASVIFGVKEVPIENLLLNKTYFFFSHTIKAQDYNMPLLDRLLEYNIRMVDFECIKSPKIPGQFPQRLVAFGRYAGIAGAFDFLRGVGEFLLEKMY